MRRLLRLPFAATALLALVGCGALAACGGGLSGDVYRGAGFAFRIGPVAEGWRQVPVSHAALAYRNERGGGSVVVNGRCGVDGEDVPLAALTQHLFMRFTEVEVAEQATVPFDRREAMHTVVRAKLDGVPMKFDVWVLKKDGCVYDLAYLAPPDRFDRGAAAFGAFVRGFATVPGHAE
jgi:hypothetical protein